MEYINSLQYFTNSSDTCIYFYDISINPYYFIITNTLQGPFDGLLGFSQGAAMAALLCGIMQKQRTGKRIQEEAYPGEAYPEGAYPEGVYPEGAYPGENSNLHVHVTF